MFCIVLLYSDTFPLSLRQQAGFSILSWQSLEPHVLAAERWPKLHLLAPYLDYVLIHAEVHMLNVPGFLFATKHCFRKVKWLDYIHLYPENWYILVNRLQTSWGLEDPQTNHKSLYNIIQYIISLYYFSWRTFLPWQMFTRSFLFYVLTSSFNNSL